MAETTLMRSAWRTGAWRSAAAGWLGGLAGNGVLGVAFTSPWVQSILYDPRWQSPLFLEITPTRDVGVSVAGLILLSGFHGYFYERLRPVMPGTTSLHRGVAWGLTIWAFYWLPQEWFIYVTLLKEPLALAALELLVLAAGSLVEGVTIAFLLDRQRERS